MYLPSMSAFGKILASALCLTLGIVLMLGTFAYYRQDVFDLTAQQLAGARYSLQIMEVNRDITTARHYAISYALTGSSEDLAFSRTATQRANHEIDSLLAIEGLPDEELQDLKTLQSLFQQYIVGLVEPLELLRESFDTRRSSFEDVTAYYISNPNHNIGNQLEEHVRHLISSVEASNRARGVQLVEAVQVVTRLLVTFGLVLAVLAVLVLWSIRRMARRNRVVAGLCTKIASGDTSVKMRQFGSDDPLSSAVNAMINSLHMAEEHANRIAAGDILSMMPERGENDGLARALNNMTAVLRQTEADHELRKWHQRGHTQLLEFISGDLEIGDVAKHSLAVMIGHLKALLGAFYIPSEDKQSLVLIASHAVTSRYCQGESIAIGSGMLGQAIADQDLTVVRDLPADYLAIASGLGETAPREVMLVPVFYRGKLMAALELATLGEFDDRHIAWMRRSLDLLAVALFTLTSRNRIETLLQASQEQTLLLKKQQQEVLSSNEELMQQAERLRSSEEELRVQSETLQDLNAELEEKNENLDLQAEEMDQKNQALKLIQADLEDRSKQLEISGKYKSEFLANMSHELRTPLNSVLLLSRSLLDNDTGNLDEDQLESVGIIDKGGKDLLALINDILDLSKVESGKMSVIRDNIHFSDIADSMSGQFRHVAADRGIDFKVEIGDLANVAFFSDIQRVEQILKNLLSNALKFTREGSVTLSISLRETTTTMPAGTVSVGQGLSFSVRDTGIGIQEGKIHEIWEAFQQADGTTSRNFGGTGLGLTISRQLAQLLGGSIQLTSVPGEGSTFTLALPLDGLVGTNLTAEPGLSPEHQNPATANADNLYLPAAQPGGSMAAAEANPVGDDRDASNGNLNSLLIIEDDLDLARVLLGRARKRSFRGLVSTTGAEGLALARQFVPLGILLDLGLPDMDGMEVLEQLKADPRTRHIPVHIVSARDRDPVTPTHGAMGFLQKPITAESISRVFESITHCSSGARRKLLIVEDSPVAARTLQKLLGNGQTDIELAGSGKEALEACNNNTFDCIILDLGLPDMTGEEVLNKMEEAHGTLPPIIINTARDLTEDEYRNLQRHSASVVIKGKHSPGRLLDEVSLFLHTVESGMPLHQRRLLQELHGGGDVLEGKKVLLVDDDIRNTFALSKVLTQRGLKVIMADDGKLAIEKLTANPDVDIVLMDIMMPEMDGYEAIEIIRGKAEHADLPVIAITAKAMAEDRKKCIDAGANDYLTKPVDIDKLTSIMRVWLSRSN